MGNDDTVPKTRAELRAEIDSVASLARSEHEKATITGYAYEAQIEKLTEKLKNTE
jgi:hypothetical protein